MLYPHMKWAIAGLLLRPFSKPLSYGDAVEKVGVDKGKIGDNSIWPSTGENLRIRIPIDLLVL
jgi:hypothetical protein